ncbi:MAG: gliding motility-associated C-terminal domain-containing protein [Bacteroidia bacterium]
MKRFVYLFLLTCVLPSTLLAESNSGNTPKSMIPSCGFTLQTTITPETCAGLNDGSANITAIGAVDPVTYVWQPGNLNGGSQSNLAPGTYTVVITDNTACSETTTVVVPAATAINLSTSVTHVTCPGGNNGSINLTVSGGSAPYTYVWSNAASVEDISNIAAGTYSVVVTDNNGCQQNLTNIVVNQPAAIAAPANITSVNCFGNSNGAIDITVSGGTGPYSYIWSNGATTQDISGLSAGNYAVTITDANNCQASFNYNVNQPLQITLALQVTNINCFGNTNGAINLSVVGGTTPYSYNWSNGATTEDISGLTANTYSVTVTDANGCTANGSATVTAPSAITLSTNITNATCSGVNNGSIDLILSGGTGPYNFFWSNGATSEDITGLGAGTYTVTVTDANGCQASTSATITQPSGITLTTSSTPSTCSGNTGTATVSASGGSGTYTYLWNDPFNQTTATANNLAAGTYSVTVTDGTGCVTATSVIVNSSSGLSATASVTDATCYGASTGAIDITVTGGNSPFTYLWSNNSTSQDLSNISAGTYSLLITDNTNCTFFISATVNQPQQITLNFVTQNPLCNNATNGQVLLTVAGGTPNYTYLWSNNATSANLSNVGAGSYSVTITDQNNCTANGTVTLSNPPILLLGFNTTNATCNGSSTGAIDLNVQGGTPPYNYLWSNGAQTQDISNIPAGNYSVTVSDTNNCSAALAINVSEPAPLSIALDSITHLLCNGTANGGIDISVTGGTLPYTYSWDNGATSQDLSGLSGGTYTVIVSDFFNCSASQSYTVNEPSAIEINITTTPADCGFNNGSAVATVSGGTPGYSYLWNTTPPQTSLNANQLAAGGYSFQVTDQNGCIASESAIITSIGGPIISLDSILHSKCATLFNDTVISYTNDGAIYISVTGATPPYTYQWSSGQTTQDITNLLPGNYLVTVRDVNFCLSTLSFTINGPAPLIFDVTTTDVLCNGQSNGAIDLTVSGGTPPYTYFWNKGGNLIAQTQDLNNITAGTYVLQLNDGNNCIRGASVTIGTQSTPIIIGLNEKRDESCDGKSDGKLDVSVSGGTSPYTFNWSNQATTQSIADIPKGNYTLNVTDALGCTATQSFIVGVKGACTDINIPNSFSPNGDGINDKWIIRNLDKFAQNTVEIYNRWGQLIFSTNGYDDSNAWDGTFNGEPVSSAVYYYFINLGNGTDIFKGTVTVVR